MDNQKTGMPSQEDKSAKTLEKMNDTLSRLGSGAKFNGVPQIPGTEPLKGRNVVLVDDTQGVLESFAPVLVAVTDGESDFIFHKDQKIDELVEELLTLNPEVILLDSELSKNINGGYVATVLRERGFPGKIIGFSAKDPRYSMFPADKVDASVRKNVADVAGTLRNVAEAISLKSN